MTTPPDDVVVACSTSLKGLCGAWDPAVNRWHRLDSPPTTLPGASHLVSTADGAYAFLVTVDAPEPELAAVLDLRVARPVWRDAMSGDRAAFHIALGHAALIELGLS